jgi:hypothetical protein
MASKTELWNKPGRFVSVVVVLCFFLPFFGISCQGMEIVKFSGADMVFGCKPGGMITEAENTAKQMGGPDAKGKAEIPNVERKPLAMIAFAAAIAAAAVAWVMRGKRAALIPIFLLALVGTGAMVGLYVTITSELKDTAKEGPGGMKAGPPDEPGDDLGSMEIEPPDELKNIDIDAGARFGFWLTSLGFLAIAGITAMALREKEPPPPPPPAA